MSRPRSWRRIRLRNCSGVGRAGSTAMAVILRRRSISDRTSRSRSRPAPRSLVEGQVQPQDVDARRGADDRARSARCARSIRAADRGRPAARGPRRRGPPGSGAASGLMCGSRPRPEAVTRSTGRRVPRRVAVERPRPRSAILSRRSGFLVAEVRAAGRVGGVGVVVDRRGAGVEVPVGGERLGDQRRADHRAVAAVDQAPLGLVGEERAGPGPRPPPGRRRRRGRRSRRRRPGHCTVSRIIGLAPSDCGCRVGRRRPGSARCRPAPGAGRSPGRSA